VPRLVHFPESWTPAPAQIVAAEPKVQRCVESQRRRLHSALPRYFRHYSGTTIKQEPTLRIQFFDTRRYRADVLTHALEVVDGNGDDYFVVLFGLQSETCSF
jgi:hypothetical protein